MKEFLFPIFDNKEKIITNNINHRRNQTQEKFFLF